MMDWLNQLVLVIASTTVIAVIMGFAGKAVVEAFLKQKLQEYDRELEHKNATALQKDEQHHSMRMAAIDKRLAVHQEAFALWWRLRFSVHNAEACRSLVEECEEWLGNNLLYLEPEARVSFRASYMAALNYKNLVLQFHGRPDVTGIVAKSMDQIVATGEVLIRCVGLPALNPGEELVAKPAGDPSAAEAPSG
ncbi:MAG: hypothetical protein ABIQ41_06825 [Gemmatimonadales bacterium]